MTSSVAIRHALVAQKSCFMLATNDLDRSTLPPLARLEGYTGQKHAERGCRFVQEPLLRASSLDLTQPQRIRALLRVMTVCVRVDAALGDRLRNALKAHQTPFPNHTGQPRQNPTARGVFQYFVRIHLRHMPGEGALVLNLNDPHRQLLRIWGRRYEVFYA
jgi:transposase